MVTPASACANNLMGIGKFDRNCPVRNTIGGTEQENKNIDTDVALISSLEIWSILKVARDNTINRNI